ncbi:MAG: hypothetical protein LBC79_04075 [Deltaproteobacteria bacterium]|nr:hypothetical protein [Deltaproteobacteria bacterium]
MADDCGRLRPIFGGFSPVGKEKKNRPDFICGAKNIFLKTREDDIQNYILPNKCRVFLEMLGRLAFLKRCGYILPESLGNPAYNAGLPKIHGARGEAAHLWTSPEAVEAWRVSWFFF